MQHILGTEYRKYYLIRGTKKLFEYSLISIDALGNGNMENQRL